VISFHTSSAVFREAIPGAGDGAAGIGRSAPDAGGGGGVGMSP
jgi:hypothetical protein